MCPGSYPPTDLYKFSDYRQKGRWKIYKYKDSQDKNLELKIVVKYLVSKFIEYLNKVV